MTETPPAGDETPDETANVPPAEPSDVPDTAETRALAAIDRIFQQGSDPAAEALALANRLTDDTTGRMSSWFRRRGGRSTG